MVDPAQIRAWLRDVPDPEIPVLSLVDLGVIRDIAWKGKCLTVGIAPTYTGCPATSVIELAVDAHLRAKGIGQIQIRRRLSPPWSSDDISDHGRAQLAAYGISPPAPGGPEACPHCGSTHVSRVSQFGSTPCKAQWRCDSCLEPFDHFKCI
ncbi:MAG: 1,2-phenylacetyl-CoA epoxidase subunit PaaD [Shimia sp.]